MSYHGYIPKKFEGTSSQVDGLSDPLIDCVLDHDSFQEVITSLFELLKVSFVFFLKDNRLILLIESNRNVFEITAKQDPTKQDESDSRIRGDATFSFNYSDLSSIKKACCQDCEWIARIVEIMSKLKGHGLN